MRALDQNERGFTLVEMLVALALTSMTALMLVGGLAAARTAWTRADRQAVAGEEVAAAQAVLRARLEAMQPTLRFTVSGRYVDLSGDARMLSWDGPAGDAVAGPPRRWRLMLGQDNALTLLDADPLSTRIDVDAPTVAGWTPSRLIGRVRELDIAYFGAAPPDNLRRWRQAWATSGALPELVRVRLRLADNDRRVWPDLVVAPAATVSTACTPDALTGLCRPGAV